MGNFKYERGTFKSELMLKAISTIDDNIKSNEDGSYTVKITINDKEVDFDKFVDKIENYINETSTQKAKDLIENKYIRIIKETDKILETIKEHNELFEV